MKIRLDAIAYSNLLNIYTKTSHARAEDLLWEMVEDYLTGNESAKPRIRNFNTVLAMWSKSNKEQAPERAHAIVARLIELNETGELDVKPDTYTYSLLLKTWYVVAFSYIPIRISTPLSWKPSFFFVQGHDDTTHRSIEGCPVPLLDARPTPSRRRSRPSGCHQVHDVH
jgi:hypothetical protein